MTNVSRSSSPQAQVKREVLGPPRLATPPKPAIVPKASTAVAAAATVLGCLDRHKRRNWNLQVGTNLGTWNLGSFSLHLVTWCQPVMSWHSNYPWTPLIVMVPSRLIWTLGTVRSLRSRCLCPDLSKRRWHPKAARFIQLVSFL